jgi:suppressor of ftsI
MTQYARHSILVVVALLSAAMTGGFAQTIADPPSAHSPITLSAVTDSTGRAAFSFDGKQNPPVIRALPGESVRITYHNEMSATIHGKCATGPCMNMTNLHFHGLHVSPNSPQDDVLSMVALPGESLEYRVDIPLNQPPGLYWYHTHPHGESNKQVRDGMSGAIVIEGIERYVPEVAKMRERILILRDRAFEDGDPQAAQLKRAVEVPAQKCGLSTEELEEVFTVNGAVRAKIPVAAGERQFWRVVNASPDLYADIEIPGEQLEIVALDGMPLAYHDPQLPTRMVRHILVPPAGRVEAIVTGPNVQGGAKLRTRCFDTGADGDPNPAMVLADLVNAKTEAPVKNIANQQNPVVVNIPESRLTSLKKQAPDFTVTFTEDKQGFYINGKKFGPADAPMTVVHVGDYHHWRIANKTHEVHPFHIHQVHFLFYAASDHSAAEAEWLDTVNVPAEGSIDLIMDFTDPIIRGMSLFHCHLLSHENKGMMAKILFE